MRGVSVTTSVGAYNEVLKPATPSEVVLLHPGAVTSLLRLAQPLAQDVNTGLKVGAALWVMGTVS